MSLPLLFGACCLFDRCCLLFAVCCLLVVVRCLLFGVVGVVCHVSLFVVCCLLVFVCHVLCVMIVRRWLFVVAVVCG